MAETILRRVAIRVNAEEGEASASPAVEGNLWLVALALAFLLVACSLFYVWAHHQIVTLGYEISQAQEKEQELLNTNKRLRLELAALKSPSRIESKALKEFGFVKAEKEQLVIVR
jgi:cell division protein FtsL